MILRDFPILPYPIYQVPPCLFPVVAVVIVKHEDLLEPGYAYVREALSVIRLVCFIGSTKKAANIYIKNKSAPVFEPIK